MAVVFDSDDLHGNDVALPGDFVRVSDAALHQLGDVDQTFDRPLQADERAERRQLRHLAGNNLAFPVLGDDLFPALRLGTPDAERDLLRLRVNLENVDGDLVSDLEHLVR